MDHWYVVKTKPQREDQVCRLFSQANLETFFPRFRDSSSYRRGTQPIPRLRPLFPSYLFLKTDLVNAEKFHMVKYTRGVSRILCADNRPLPVPAEIMKAFLLRTNGEGIIERQTHLRKGDRVRIRKGLLKDLEGVFDGSTPDNERVVILLKHVAFKVSARLHWAEVEKL